MDRDGDAALVSTPSFSEQEMDREPPERKIFTRADTADSAGVFGIAVDTGIYCQRNPSFPLCICFFEMERGSLPCQDAPYGLRVLGICLDVPASGDTLGNGYGDGGKRIPNRDCGRHFPRR